MRSSAAWTASRGESSPGGSLRRSPRPSRRLSVGVVHACWWDVPPGLLLEGAQRREHRREEAEHALEVIIGRLDALQTRQRAELGERREQG